MKRITSLLVYMTVGMFLLWHHPPLSAQTDQRIQINYVETTSTDDSEAPALLTRVYFNILDGEGRVIPQPKIEAGSMFLNDGRLTPAAIQPASAPIYLTLVLDISGSMRTVLPTMQQAAVEAIKLAPSNTQFSVVLFNETIETVFPFDGDRVGAIQAIQAIPNAEQGTCLYDAGYAAVQQIQEAVSAQQQARRAVILFTDGRDERTQGGGDTCSSFTFEQLLKLAQTQASPVPLYTIGLKGADQGINETELFELAQRTGGLSLTDGEANLERSFAYMVSAISNQFVAESQLYPQAGEQPLTFSLNLQDSVLSSSFILNVDRSYSPPIQNVNIRLDAVTYVSDINSYQIDLLFENESLIDTVEVEVWSRRDGLQLNQYSFAIDQIITNGHIRLPADRFEQGHSYTLRISPFLADGEPARSEATGQPLLIEHDLNHVPPVSSPALIIRTAEFLQEPSRIKLSLSPDGSEQIDSLEGYMLDRATNGQVLTFALPIAPSIEVDLGDLPAGQYDIVLNGLNQAGELLASTNYEVTYILPAQAGLIGQTLTGLQDNLWIIGSIITLMTLFILWMMYRSQQKRELTGTPFLSGQIQTAGQPFITPASTPLKKIEPAPASTNRPRLIKETQPVLFVRRSTLDLPTNEAIPILKTPFTLGRKECDFNVDHPKISRRHAVILNREGRFFLKDLGSGNGTFLNERRLPDDEIEAPLGNQCEIRLGKEVIFTFEIGKQQGSATK